MARIASAPWSIWDALRPKTLPTPGASLSFSCPLGEACSFDRAPQHILVIWPSLSQFSQGRGHPLQSPLRSTEIDPVGFLFRLKRGPARTDRVLGPVAGSERFSWLGGFEVSALTCGWFGSESNRVTQVLTHVSTQGSHFGTSVLSHCHLFPLHGPAKGRTLQSSSGKQQPLTSLISCGSRKSGVQAAAVAHRPLQAVT